MARLSARSGTEMQGFKLSRETWNSNLHFNFRQHINMLKVQKPFLFSWQNCNLIIFYLERKAMQITNHILKEVMISELWHPKIKIKKNHLGGKIRTAINTEWSKWELYFLRNSIHCNQIYCVCGGGGTTLGNLGLLKGKSSGLPQAQGVSCWGLLPDHASPNTMLFMFSSKKNEI